MAYFLFRCSLSFVDIQQLSCLWKLLLKRRRSATPAIKHNTCTNSYIQLQASSLHGGFFIHFLGERVLSYTEL